MRLMQNKYVNKIYTKRVSEADKECLNKVNDRIYSVLESFVNIKIKKCKLIKTCDGINVLVKGYKIVKIHYLISQNHCSVRSKNFIEPFYVAIPIKNCVEVCNIWTKVECCEIDVCEYNKIFIYTLINVYVQVKEFNNKNDNRTNFRQGNKSTNESSKRMKKSWNIKNDNLCE